MTNKLYIKTMGCQMNVYDSDKMADVLRQSHGFELTKNAEEANLLLVNTCSIREKAQEKVFSQLGRWKSLKDGNPGLMIGVGGCVASQEGSKIMDRAPYVDMVLARKHCIVSQKCMMMQFILMNLLLTFHSQK